MPIKLWRTSLCVVTSSPGHGRDSTKGQWRSTMHFSVQRPVTRVACALLTCGALLQSAAAQVPFENGISLAEVTGGLQGPSSIARDSAGRVY